jgi:hypothetical protein
MIKSRRMKWIGHLEEIRAKKNTYICLSEYGKEGDHYDNQYISEWIKLNGC